MTCLLLRITEKRLRGVGWMWPVTQSRVANLVVRLIPRARALAAITIPAASPVWVAGGGFKSGYAYGETDEFGFRGINGRVHMHDLHATLLHQLGLDHKRLTYKHAGRDFRLTDVHGHVVHEIIDTTCPRSFFVG